MSKAFPLRVICVFPVLLICVLVIGCTHAEDLILGRADERGNYTGFPSMFFDDRNVDFNEVGLREGQACWCPPNFGVPKFDFSNIKVDPGSFK
ncbi:MAG: hypothetical protein ACYSUL_13020 [Planctomycetota bacterium]|jgi:hypothetical protein